jgi:hypothetical protein
VLSLIVISLYFWGIDLNKKKRQLKKGAIPSEKIPETSTDKILRPPLKEVNTRKRIEEREERTLKRHAVKK